MTRVRKWVGGRQFPVTGSLLLVTIAGLVCLPSKVRSNVVSHITELDVELLRTLSRPFASALPDYYANTRTSNPSYRLGVRIVPADQQIERTSSLMASEFALTTAEFERAPRPIAAEIDLAHRFGAHLLSSEYRAGHGSEAARTYGVWNGDITAARTFFDPDSPFLSSVGGSFAVGGLGGVA